MICEELSPDELNHELKNQIILGLINNITENSPNNDVQKCNEFAIKGLFHAIPMVTQNFLVTHERDYIMGKLFVALCNQEEEVRVTAM